MNKKELSEIRRRFKPDHDNISRIYGCYVNAAKEIVSTIDMAVGLMSEDEGEMYIKLLKKGISGTLGRNLMSVEFGTSQVGKSDEHRLLEGLRSSKLEDEGLRQLFYERVIESLNMDEMSYVILLACDSYDVPFKAADGDNWAEGSNEVFDYIICSVCPVKDASMALRYFAEEQNFRGVSTGHILSNPEIGFMYPAFDDRCANIYNVLYYSKSSSEIHDEFIQGIFNVEKIPMSAKAQKNAFETALSEALGEDCSLDVVKRVHGQIRERVVIHKESKEPELPEISVFEVDDILRDGGVDEEKIEAFNEACEREFGDDGVFNPDNLIEAKKFELKTEEVKISVLPEYAFSVETRVIDGRKYILIPVGEGVSVNGLEISISDEIDG